MIEAYDALNPSQGVVVAGTGQCGFNGDAAAPAKAVQLDLPQDVAFNPIAMDGTVLFIADMGNRRIRAFNVSPTSAAQVGGTSIGPGEVATVAGTDVLPRPPIGNPGGTLGFCAPGILARLEGSGTDKGTLLIGDTCTEGSATIGTAILMDLGGATFTARLAGDTTPGLAPDDRPAGLVGLGTLGGAAFGPGQPADPSAPCGDPGESFLSDSDENAIYRVHFNDRDRDCIGDTVDNCPDDANEDQVDSDGDGRGDACCYRRRKTCSSIGDCGDAPDGCGGVVTGCGSCTLPAVCGGSGRPNVCSALGQCVPRTCTELGAECGTLSDGCGGVLSCGNNGACSTGTCGDASNPFLHCAPLAAREVWPRATSRAADGAAMAAMSH